MTLLRTSTKTRFLVLTDLSSSITQQTFAHYEPISGVDKSSLISSSITQQTFAHYEPSILHVQVLQCAPGC